MRLVLKNIRIKPYNLLAIVVAWIHTIVFTVVIFSKNDTLIKVIAITGLLVVDTAFVLRNQFKDRHAFLQPYSIMYYCLVVAWPLLGYYWVTPVLMLITVLDIMARQTPVVYFSAGQIEFPSIPKKIIKWEELENVVLKDGVLTIDFKDDKLLQPEIDPAYAVDEAAFNIYTAKMLMLKTQLN